MRWRDDLPESWDDVQEVPPLPAEVSVEDQERIRFGTVPSGYVIRDQLQTGAYVCARDRDSLVEDLADEI